MLCYVPVMVIVARTAGVRASTVAAVLSFLALDLVFVPPYYHLRVASVYEWVGLLVFLTVALVTGQQTGILLQRERAAVRRQEELELLNSLSFRIVTEKSATSTALFIVARVVEILGASRSAVYVVSQKDATPARLAPEEDAGDSDEELALVAWVLREGKAIGLDAVSSVPADMRPVSVGAAEALPGVVAKGIYIPLQTAVGLEGVLVAVPASDAQMTAEDERLLAAVANLAALSLHRQRLDEDASRARALVEADRLKTTLVSSVSHELKTPLAAATARVTGLLEEGTDVDPARVQTELASIAVDLDRLDDSIGDLLDLSRLESDSWRPRFELHDVRDVLGTVLSRLPSSQRGRVRFEIVDGTPDVAVDFAQIARAVTNLLENALAYSGQSGDVTIGTRLQGDWVELWVEDHGLGVSDAEKAVVFDKFFRGAASASIPSGTGLGLAITREIVRTHGGDVRVEDAIPHGARFVMSLPTRVEAP